jgi:hypothetical protein
MKKCAALFFFLSVFVVISASAQQNKVVVVPIKSAGGVGTVITTVGGAAWLPHHQSPTTVTRYVTGVSVSGDGSMVLGVNAPTSFNGIEYGLESIEICVYMVPPGYLDRVEIYNSSSMIFADERDQTTDGCYTYPVGEYLGKGGGVYLLLNGGGEVRIQGTTFTWKKSNELTQQATMRTIPSGESIDGPE